MSTVSKTDSSQQTPRQRRRGEGNVYQREGGTIWWIRYHHRGKPKRDSSESTDREYAEKLLDQRLFEMKAERQGLQAFNPKAEKIYVDTVLDALEKEYRLAGGRALAQFKSHLKPVRAAFGDMRAVAVTAKHVDDYIDRRLEEDKKAPGTVNRETQLLGQAYHLAIDRGELLSAPNIRHLKEANPRVGFFERADFEAVVVELPEYLQDFSRFAHLVAWRKGQIDSLEWSDVDRAGGIIQARPEHVKNGRSHKIAIEGELAAIIERRWEARVYQTASGPAISPYVFHLDGKPVGDFRKAWATACKKAGLMKPKLDRMGQPVTEVVDGEKRNVMVHAYLFHDFRRTGVRNMVRAGVREGVAMAISGHRTRSVFDRYNITSDDDLRQAMLQTDAHLKSQPTERKVVSIGKRL